MSNIIEFIDLHSAEGGSNKVYHCGIQEVDGGFIVPFAYGRSGSTLNTGSKTTSPTTLDKAKNIYDRLVGEKMGKGYLPSPGISGNIFGAGVTSEVSPVTLALTNKQSSGHRPQLLNPITEEEASAYINSSQWGAQEKMNGERRAIRSSVSSIEGINRKGQIVPVHPELRADVASQGRCGLIDGESIGSTLYAFDLLDRDSEDLRNQSYIDRYNALLLFCENMDNVEVVPLAVKTAEKQTLWNKVKLSGGEGVVFKRLDAVYEADRPTSGGPQLKCKFWESGTCVVIGVNAKRSIRVAVTEADGTIEIPVGNVTIPLNHEIPAVGSLVEVLYLYYYAGGSLYQPQYLGVRSDADKRDCDISKLKVYQEFSKAA